MRVDDDPSVTVRPPAHNGWLSWEEDYDLRWSCGHSARHGRLKTLRTVVSFSRDPTRNLGGQVPR